jgi:hypothetical protein
MPPPTAPTRERAGAETLDSFSAKSRIPLRQIASHDRKQVLPVPQWALAQRNSGSQPHRFPLPLAPTGRPMKDRYDTLKAVAFVLRRMDKISEELGKPGSLLESLQYEWKNLETKYQELMDRLADLPYDGCVAGRDSAMVGLRKTFPARTEPTVSTRIENPKLCHLHDK